MMVNVPENKDDCQIAINRRLEKSTFLRNTRKDQGFQELQDYTYQLFM